MQAWPLERKIQVTQTRIIEWYQHWGGKIYVSFSGGKDSTVLLDLTRRIYPDVEAVFVDTGLEYPEIREFVKSKKNVTWLRPKMRFDEVIKKYGYPVIGKEVADYVCEGRRQLKKGTTDSRTLKRLRGQYLRKDGAKSEYNCEKYEFLLYADFESSGHCCKIMKKNPLNDFAKRTGKHGMNATTTNESRLRMRKWLKFGCNVFDAKEPLSTPMAFWTEQDVLTYIKRFDLPYAKIYGEIVSDNENQVEWFDGKKMYHCTGAQRTGCMFCMFGTHLEKEPNKFQRMKITHPKQWDYCIHKLGLGEILDYIGVKYE
jgi:3'-phosphoadenosine 5'-phosphosulfate sulfotransferase (PAPS reductase)/FAD synthetase